jgi:hypothetical protein
MGMAQAATAGLEVVDGAMTRTQELRGEQRRQDWERWLPFGNGGRLGAARPLCTKDPRFQDFRAQAEFQREMGPKHSIEWSKGLLCKAAV